MRRLGQLTFLVEVKDGLMRHRHVDHIKPFQGVRSTESNDAEPDEAYEAMEDDTHLPFTDNAITLNPD